MERAKRGKRSRPRFQFFNQCLGIGANVSTAWKPHNDCRVYRFRLRRQHTVHARTLNMMNA